MKKSILKIIIISTSMLLLILDTKNAVNGAISGMNLCIRALIPSLFPFILLSILLTDILAGTTTVITKPINQLLKIPDGAESLFLIGMIGGYPVGAQVISQSVCSKTLSVHSGTRMLQFCNNAGPAFLFGVVSTQFPDQKYALLIWAVIILSSMLTAVILPGCSDNACATSVKKPITITYAMEKAIKVIGGICGWVVIFRVILAFIEKWFLWRLPLIYRVIVQMLLELANGCMALNEITDIGHRFIIAVAGLSIGGLCVLLQTQSVSGSLGIRKYITGKLIQTGFAIVIGIPVVMLHESTGAFTLPIIILSSFVLALIILSNWLKKRKINCRISTLSGV